MNPENPKPEESEVPQQPIVPEVPKPLEQKLDQLESEKIAERNKKIIQDFDIETKTKEEEEEKIKEKISQLEETKKTNIKLNVPASFNGGVDLDISELQGRKTELTADLEKRKPNETEQMIGGEIIKIDKKIENIKTAESQDLPGMVPSSIVGARKKDVEGLEKQKERMLEESNIAKVEKIEKYYAETKAAEQKPVEKTKETEEARAEKKEKAVEFLSNPEITKEKPKEIIEAYKIATGENLKEKRDKLVEQNFKERGMTVISGKDAIEKYRQRATERAEKKIFSEERSDSVMVCWDRLAKNEQAKYTENGVVNLVAFKDSLRGKAEKLKISEDVFYSLVKAGYEPENMKKRGFFGRLFIGDVKVVRGDMPNPIDLSKKDFENLINKTLGDQLQRVGKEAQKRVDLKIIEGTKRLTREKNICALNIIKKTVEEYKSDKTSKQEVIKQEEKKEKDPVAESLANYKKIGYKGGNVNVKRTSGKTEGDWFIMGWTGGKVKVAKSEKGTGVDLIKVVPEEEFLEWNKKEVKIESGGKSEKKEEKQKKAKELQEKKEVSASKFELPADKERVRQLKEKLNQYKERYAKQENSSATPEEREDTRYKLNILQALLTHHKIERRVLIKKFTQKYGLVDKKAFAKAFNVIEDYAKTSGKNTREKRSSK